MYAFSFIATITKITLIELHFYKMFADLEILVDAKYEQSP